MLCVILLLRPKPSGKICLLRRGQNARGVYLYPAFRHGVLLAAVGERPAPLCIFWAPIAELLRLAAQSGIVRVDRGRRLDLVEVDDGFLLNARGLYGFTFLLG